MRFMALALCGLILALSPACAAEQAYLSTMEDVPLLPGFSEVAEEGMVFDQPEGRIVVAVARGASAGDEGVAAYRTLLPALGWVPEGENLVFIREGERLSIEAMPDGDEGILAVFTLSPENM